MNVEQPSLQAGRGFTGFLGAVVTPIGRDGTIDFSVFRALVELHERHGSDALFFMGVAGEGAVLTDPEQEAVVTQTHRHRLGSMRFFYGCAGINTSETIRKVRFAEASGVDSAVVTVPANSGPDLGEARAYLLAVAEATSIPLGTFNNPARLVSDRDRDRDTLLRVFQHPSNVPHEEGTSRTGQMGESIGAAPGVSILADDAPDPNLLVQAMALGASGISNVAGNAVPREMRDLSAPWRAGEHDLLAFRDLYFQLRPLLSFLHGARSPKPVKGLMKALGLPSGDPPCRSPRSTRDRPGSASTSYGARACSDLTDTTTGPDT